MKHDDFLIYIYIFSELSEYTKKTYMSWVTKCCRYYGKTHLLDLAPDDLDSFRLMLLQERHYSPASDTIVYNAFRHTYTVLLPQVDTMAAHKYQGLFSKSPKQPYKLPELASQEQIQQFFEAVPHTATGNIIRMIYLSGRRLEDICNSKSGMRWKCSRQYAQQVCARIARQVGIKHGFGLTGLRSAGILNRIANREDDTELARIREDSGLSLSQFQRYLKASQI